MSRLAKLAFYLRAVAWPVTAGMARLRQYSPRPTRFAGAWDDRAAALSALPEAARKGYDDPDIADVSFDAMSRVVPADYAVLFWLHRLLKPGTRILDAGGHLGTKYLAFQGHLSLDGITWTVQDLPGIVTAARAAQSEGRLSAELEFVDTPQGAEADFLLCSGLLQYLDISLSDYVAALAAPPAHILLNKVATRPGPDLVTLERIGANRVPYRIRNREAFEAELEAMGYRVEDSWDLPGLAHVIPTHPWLGPSLSRGYLLARH